MLLEKASKQTPPLYRHKEKTHKATSLVGSGHSLLLKKKSNPPDQGKASDESTYPSTTSDDATFLLLMPYH